MIRFLMTYRHYPKYANLIFYDFVGISKVNEFVNTDNVYQLKFGMTGSNSSPPYQLANFG